jgi:hypothetical protein
MMISHKWRIVKCNYIRGAELTLLGNYHSEILGSVSYYAFGIVLTQVINICGAPRLVNVCSVKLQQNKEKYHCKYT